MEQATNKGTLGARILAQLADAEQHPLEAARRAAQRAGEKAVAQFNTVEALFDRIKAAVIADVEAGIFPKPVQLTRSEESALETFGWYSRPDKRMTSHHACYQLQAAFDEWARDEEIRWAFCENHDSGGENQSWDFRVLKPGLTNKTSSIRSR